MQRKIFQAPPASSNNTVCAADDRYGCSLWVAPYNRPTNADANLPHSSRLHQLHRHQQQFEHGPGRAGADAGSLASGTASPVGLCTNGTLSAAIGTSPPPLLQSS